MGNCCGGEKDNAPERNDLRPKAIGEFSGLSIVQVVQLQALIRGFLTRRKVKRVYGFEMTKGLLYRSFDMDPEKLEQQRMRVQAIRERLPEFEYGIYENEDYEPDV